MGLVDTTDRVGDAADENVDVHVDENKLVADKVKVGGGGRVIF